MSANASRGKILTLDEYRKQRHAAKQGPEPFDPNAFLQLIRRAQSAPDKDERELAAGLALRQAEELLQVVAVMAGEITAFKQQVKALAQQAADTSTINSVLLERAGGVVRMPFQWFADYQPPNGAGFMVNEEDGPDGREVVIRAIVVDAQPPEGVGSVSADQQTEGA